MMGGKSWDAWIADYARSHENRVNRHTHLFGIPMIALSVPLLAASAVVTGLWPWAVGLFVGGWLSRS